MSKEDFLQSYNDALRRERRLGEKVVELRERQRSAGAIRYTPRVVTARPTGTGMPHGTDISDLSDYIVKLEEQIAALIDAKSRTDAVSEAMCEVFERLPRQDEYDVLYYRYVRGWKPQKIADKLFMARRTVYRVEEAAIEHLDITDYDAKKIEKLLA